MTGDEEDRDLDAFETAANQIVPEGGVLEGGVAVIAYMEPDSGEAMIKIVMAHDVPHTATVGLLEKAKFDLLMRMHDE